MTMGYSELLEWAVTNKLRRGMTIYEAEERYGINEYTLEHWLLTSEASDGAACKA